MRTCAKKNECANAPVGPFTTFTHCAYGCNIRNELISAAKAVGGDAPGAPQSPTSTTEYAYQYDDIGNRISSFDLGTNRTYTANELNQYSLITNLTSDAGLQTSEFEPQYDDDMRPRRRRRVARRSEATEPRSGRKRPRNQTLIQTSTGIWQVQYNGENRPIFWSNGATNLFWSLHYVSDVEPFSLAKRLDKNNLYKIRCKCLTIGAEIMRIV